MPTLSEMGSVVLAVSLTPDEMERVKEDILLVSHNGVLIKMACHNQR